LIWTSGPPLQATDTKDPLNADDLPIWSASQDFNPTFLMVARFFGATRLATYFECYLLLVELLPAKDSAVARRHDQCQQNRFRQKSHINKRASQENSTCNDPPPETSEEKREKEIASGGKE